MKFAKELTFVLAGCVFAIHAYSHNPDNLDGLSAVELKRLHDLDREQLAKWKDREKDAMPKIILREERVKAHRMAQEATAMCAGLSRNIKDREDRKAALQCELDVLYKEQRAAEMNEIRCKRISEDYRKRSTSEKVVEKIKHFSEALRRIHAAFYRKSVWERRHISLE